MQCSAGRGKLGIDNVVKMDAEMVMGERSAGIKVNHPSTRYGKSFRGGWRLRGIGWEGWEILEIKYSLRFNQLYLLNHGKWMMMMWKEGRNES